LWRKPQQVTYDRPEPQGQSGTMARDLVA
jgi:hypothetical protein